MARASTRTLLSLDRFAQIIGVNPLHFNQVKIDSLSPIVTCDEPIYQYDWQDAGKSGRESLADAIDNVEDQFANLLGYYPGVKWDADERHVFANNRPGFNLFRFKTDNGYIIEGGVESTSLIAANQAVVYTDVDGDGYKETATVTVNVGTVTNLDEVAIVYPGKAGDLSWEVRPTTVAINVNTQIATIIMRREQLVVSSILEGFTQQVADGETDVDFLTLVDVYRHYNDPSQQANILWPPLPGPWPSASVSASGSTDASAVWSQTGYMVPDDARNGMISIWPGNWNGTGFDYTCWIPGMVPQRAQLWYRSGVQNGRSSRPMTTMNQRWERAITYMVLATLDRPMCACPVLENFTRYWREDLARTQVSGGDSESYRLAPSALLNPLGTTRGAMNAWRLIQSEMLGQAALYA